MDVTPGGGTHQEIIAALQGVHDHLCSYKYGTQHRRQGSGQVAVRQAGLQCLHSRLPVRPAGKAAHTSFQGGEGTLFGGGTNKLKRARHSCTSLARISAWLTASEATSCFARVSSRREPAQECKLSSQFLSRCVFRHCFDCCGVCSLARSRLTRSQCSFVSHCSARAILHISFEQLRSQLCCRPWIGFDLNQLPSSGPTAQCCGAFN